MNRRNAIATIGGAALVSALPAGLSAMAQGAGQDPAKLPALQGGDFSTATSQLAERKAASGAVREFAKLEIAEQAAVAQAFGSQPGAAGITPEKAALLQSLEATEGAAFDVAYVEGQIAAHEELLAIHQTYARSGQDPMARGASIVGVAGIASHLFLLRNIRRQI